MSREINTKSSPYFNSETIIIGSSTDFVKIFDQICCAKVKNLRFSTE